MHQNMSSGMLQRPEEKQDPHEHLGETQGIFFAIKFIQLYPLILYEIFSSLNVAHTSSNHCSPDDWCKHTMKLGVVKI